MAYPIDLDSLTNPSSTDKTDNPSYADQHKDANNAIEALQLKVGIDDSVDEDSVDYNLSIRSHGSNLLKNGNFIHAGQNGYGNTPDDWSNSGGNPVQGGFPSLTKAEFLALTGVTDANLEGLWLLNEASGNALDLSSNEYDLTETGGTIGAGGGGIMATARDFELADTEYFTVANADCANLEIAGSQTWGCWIALESLVTCTLMGKYDKTNINDRHSLHISSGVVKFLLKGLDVSHDDVASRVLVEAGKAYFICATFDADTDKLEIWVNGIKTTETGATGTADDSNSAFSIGADLGAVGDAPRNYFDGLMQGAFVVNGRMTDAQIKRLWAYMSYGGVKLRRNTTDGYLYQDLSQDLVERFRGKTIAVRAEMYQEVASVGQIAIYDGTEDESTASVTIDEWETASVTKTISASATQIQVRLKVSDSNGCVWFKEAGLFEGKGALLYTPAEEDIVKSPGLMKVEPTVVNDQRALTFRVRETPTIRDKEISGVEQNYTDWELQDIVGETAQMVLLRVAITDDTAGSYVSFRENGDTGTTAGVEVEQVLVSVASKAVTRDVLVKCDTDQKIEVKVGDVGGAAIGSVLITVIGWYEPVVR